MLIPKRRRSLALVVAFAALWTGIQVGNALPAGAFAIAWSDTELSTYPYHLPVLWHEARAWDADGIGGTPGPKCGGRMVPYQQIPYANYVPCVEWVVPRFDVDSSPSWTAALRDASKIWTFPDTNCAPTELSCGQNLVDLTYTATDPPNTYGHDGLYVEPSDLGWCSTCTYNKYGQSQKYWNACVYNPNVPNDCPVPARAAILYVNVKISTNSHVPWAAYPIPPDVNTISLRAVMAHELGHGIGLQHPVRGPSSGRLMQCNLAHGEDFATLPNDEKNGVGWAYSTHAGTFGSPGSIPC